MEKLDQQSWKQLYAQSLFLNPCIKKHRSATINISYLDRLEEKKKPEKRIARQTLSATPNPYLDLNNLSEISGSFRA